MALREENLFNPTHRIFCFKQRIPFSVHPSYEDAVQFLLDNAHIRGAGHLRIQVAEDYNDGRVTWRSIGRLGRLNTPERPGLGNPFALTHKKPVFKTTSFEETTETEESY